MKKVIGWMTLCVFASIFVGLVADDVQERGVAFASAKLILCFVSAVALYASFNWISEK